METKWYGPLKVTYKKKPSITTLIYNVVRFIAILILFFLVIEESPKVALLLLLVGLEIEVEKKEEGNG